MERLLQQAKRAGLLWLFGFKEACCLHRVVLFCIRSKTLSIRTGQCFLLNGLFYLGSLKFLKSVVIPVLLWILPSQCEQSGREHLCANEAAMSLYSFLRLVLIELFYILWFYPLYAFSFVVSGIWYNDIAKHAFEVLKSREPLMEKSSSKNDISDPQNSTQRSKPGGFEGAILGMGELLYSFLLLNIFFIEVYATGFIPYIGKAINFLLLSWLYSYYCFEYKWNLSELSLDKRLDFFESNWAFFAGFGSPCVLAMFFYPPLVSFGVMSVLLPLFVLTAAGSEAEQVVDSLRKSWGGAGPGKLQVFYVANALSMLVLNFFRETAKDQ